MRSPGPRAVARGLTALFNGLWWWVLVASTVLVPLMLLAGWNVNVQIGPDGEPNFVAGSDAEMVLPVAFALDGPTARVTTRDGGNSATIEHATGTLRLAHPERRWLALAAAAVMVAFTLWILAELAGVCRSVRDGQPFAPRNTVRIRRLALALVLAELARAAIVYAAHAYAAARFGGAGLAFTASLRLDPFAIVSASILLVLAEVFRTGTRLDEDQSLTV